MLPTADFMNLGANGNFDPSAVWAGTTTLWIADSAAGAVYGYSRAAMRPDAAQNFPAATLRAAGNVNPTGLWSDGTYLYVSDATTDRVYVYRLDTKARVAAREFALDAAVNGAPAGLHGAADGAAGGGVLWVADRVSDRLYAYDLTAGSVGARLSTRDVPLAGGNGDPTGLWGDGTTFWAADGVDGKAYAYSRAARRPAPALDLALTGNAAPAGFWADAAGAAGGTAYSADSVNDRLGNYALPARNYNLERPGRRGRPGVPRPVERRNDPVSGRQRIQGGAGVRPVLPGHLHRTRPGNRQRHAGERRRVAHPRHDRTRQRHLDLRIPGQPHLRLRLLRGLLEPGPDPGIPGRACCGPPATRTCGASGPTEPPCGRWTRAAA